MKYSPLISRSAKPWRSAAALRGQRARLDGEAGADGAAADGKAVDLVRKISQFCKFLQLWIFQLCKISLLASFSAPRKSKRRYQLLTPNQCRRTRLLSELGGTRIFAVGVGRSELEEFWPRVEVGFDTPLLESESKTSNSQIHAGDDCPRPLSRSQDECFEV